MCRGDSWGVGPWPVPAALFLPLLMAGHGVLRALFTFTETFSVSLFL